MAELGDKSKLTGGPADFKLGTSGSEASKGHTQGGITATITPANRGRVVDQYGSSWVDVIHTGDDVRITAPLSQWELATIQEVYNPGLSGTTYWGVGREAGYVYTTQSCVIVPLLTADVAKKLEFFRVTPVGSFSVGHNNDNDRIFETEFAALVDPTKANGSEIGKIHIS